MAEFCNQCAKTLGFLSGDFVNLPANDYDATRFPPVAYVICEGCGVTTVDTQGNCVSTSCGRQHHLQLPPRNLPPPLLTPPRIIALSIIVPTTLASWVYPSPFWMLLLWPLVWWGLGDGGAKSKV